MNSIMPSDHGGEQKMPCRIHPVPWLVQILACEEEEEHCKQAQDGGLDPVLSRDAEQPTPPTARKASEDRRQRVSQSGRAGRQTPRHQGASEVWMRGLLTAP